MKMTTFLFRALVATALVSTCEPSTEPCRCSAHGDPHFTTCDQHSYDYMGKCVYVTAESCKGDGPYFRVEQRDAPVYRNSYATVTQEMYVHLDEDNDGKYDTEILLLHGLRVQVQRYGSTDKVDVNLPANDPDKLYKVVSAGGSGLILETNFGLKLTWDGGYNWELVIPTQYKDKICGLCGRWDDNPDNDFTLPNGQEVSLNSNENVFGNSWVSRSPEYNCAAVAKQPEGISVDLCADTELETTAGKLCDIFNQNNGPLSGCVELNAAAAFRDCKQDVCATHTSRGNDNHMHCVNIDGFVERCTALGVKVKPWRTQELCPKSCGKNSHYNPDMSNCQQTCSPLGSLDDCKEGTMEGCECDEGFILSDTMCVPREQCGCTHDDGSYYKMGQTYVNKGCTLKCTCNNGGGITCDNSFSCTEDEKCVIVNGTLGCHGHGEKAEAESDEDPKRESTPEPKDGTSEQVCGPPEAANRKCGIINETNGTFANCFDKNITIDPYFEACKKAFCSTRDNGGDEEFIRRYIEAIAQMCEDGVWRSSEICRTPEPKDRTSENDCNPPGNAEAANEICGFINEKNGPFANCFDKNINSDSYFEACKKAVCSTIANGGDKEFIRCYIETFAQMCED